MSSEGVSQPTTARVKYVRAVGPRLRVLLYVIFGLVALLGANSVYLASITFLGWLKRASGQTFENYFYMYMFLAHLVLGLLLVLPVIIFGIFHIKNAHNRPNRRAVRVGYLLFSVSLLLLFTGLALVRIRGVFDLKDPTLRSGAYWAHVITPFLALWLYILHRLAGPRIKWRVGLSWIGAGGVAVAGLVVLHGQGRREGDR